MNSIKIKVTPSNAPKAYKLAKAGRGKILGGLISALPAIGGIIGGIGQYKNAKNTNQNNADQFNYQKELNEPVRRAGLNYINTPSLYQPTTDASIAAADTVSNTAINQISDLDKYNDYSDLGFDRLLDSSGAEGTDQLMELAKAFAYNPETQGIIDQGSAEITDAHEADRQRKDLDTYRKGSLSSTGQVAADSIRKGNLGKDLAQFKVGQRLKRYDKGVVDARTEQDKNIHIAEMLSKQSGTGINRLSSLYSLFNNAQRNKLNAPLTPYENYSRLTSGLNLPQNKQVNPLLSAAATGYGLYNKYRPVAPKETA